MTVQCHCVSEESEVRFERERRSSLSGLAIEQVEPLSRLSVWWFGGSAE